MCGFYFSWRDLKPSNFYRRQRRARNPAANSASTETPGSGITTPTGTAWKAPATPAATAVPPAAPSAGVPLLTSTLAAKSGASASNVAPVSITKRWAESAIPVPSPPTSQIGLPLKSALPPSPEATPEKKPFRLNAAAPPKSEAAPNCVKFAASAVWAAAASEKSTPLPVPTATNPPLMGVPLA